MTDYGPNEERERFLNNNLTLDLVGLSEAQKRQGSIFLGGSTAEFVRPSDTFDYEKVASVVFNWGDPRAEEMFAILIEHIEAPGEHYVAFAPSTVVGDVIWDLALQNKDWDPSTAYESEDSYVEVPFADSLSDPSVLEALSSRGKQIIGKVGSRYVLFQMATAIGAADETEGAAATSAPAEKPKQDDAEIETITREEALKFIKDFIDKLTSDESDFGQLDEYEQYDFTIQVIHWIIETFGIKDYGEYSRANTIFIPTMTTKYQEKNYQKTYVIYLCTVGKTNSILVMKIRLGSILTMFIWQPNQKSPDGMRLKSYLLLSNSWLS